jgi:ubiquitin conjugation factor E4 B
MPEFLVNNIAEFLQFNAEFNKDLLKDRIMDEFLTFMVVLLSNKHCVTNPYLRGKLIEVLFGVDETS